ncbi:MAG: amidase [Candidatus Marinimicrobia bacterium]|nr:amidase [Candidatus Neomarinimicrobiota bacterium]
MIKVNGKKLISTLGVIVLLTLITSTFYYSLKEEGNITSEIISEASEIMGLKFTRSEIDSMRGDLNDLLGNYEKLREIDLPNSVPPAFSFSAILPGMKFKEKPPNLSYKRPTGVRRPQNLEDVAFWTVTRLAELIRTGQVTSVELTEMYLSRLKKYGSTLQCVITLTEDLAMKQARQADADIRSGNYKGPLHGIPWGAKDLLATDGIRTTWGGMPFREQLFDYDATVVKKLEEAGAILVAKLTMGALAWGDVWYGGKTKNPWNLDEGSSGSSAGPGAATSAGLVGFAIGSETWGSIISPSTRTGVTGLRPTYGMVSRHGVMALSWTMDKLGPMTRSVNDAALVFNEIYGPDGLDLTVEDMPFNYNQKVNLRKIKIGYLKSEFEKERDQKKIDDEVVDVLWSLGAELIPIELPDFPVFDISFILSAEAAAAFDELTRSGDDDLLVRQIKQAWPNVFRQARLIPAVEYINANRARTLLMRQMEVLFKEIDVFVAPTFGGNSLLMTNLTGHPAVVVPNGFRENNTPTSITFTGNLYEDGMVLAVAGAYQDATSFHLKHPTLPEK